MTTGNDAVLLEIFYSSHFRRSKEYAESVLLCLPRDIEAVCYDLAVGEGVELWVKLGFQSVPTIVFWCGDRIVSNMVRYADTDEVLKHLERVRLRAAQDETDTSIRPDPPDEARRPVGTDPGDFVGSQLPDATGDLPFTIEDSSGTHRYQRWNEEYVRTSDRRTGWCSPSRTVPQEEFLALRFDGPCRVEKVVLAPRIRDDGIESFRSFPKKLSLWAKTPESGDLLLWQGDDLRVGPNEVITVPVSGGRACEGLVIRVEAVHYIDGYSYPCIAQIRVLGRPISTHVRKMQALGSKRLEHFDPDCFHKTGLYASDATNLELFNLVRGQATPASYSSGRKVLWVRSGSVAVDLGGGEVHVLKAGDLGVVEPNARYLLKGLEERNSAIILLDPRATTTWEARSKRGSGSAELPRRGALVAGLSVEHSTRGNSRCLSMVTR